MKALQFKLYVALCVAVATMFITSAAFAAFDTSRPEEGLILPTVPPVGVTLKGEVVITFYSLHQSAIDLATGSLPTMAYAKALVGLVDEGGDLTNDLGMIEHHQKSPERHGFFVDLGEVKFTDPSALVGAVMTAIEQSALKEFFNRSKGLKATLTKMGTIYTAPVIDESYSAAEGTYTYDLNGNWLIGASTVVDVEVVVSKVPKK